MKSLKQLKEELALAKQELNDLGYSKPQFLIDDDDDEYQDQLEIGWAKDEVRDRVRALEEEIEEYEANDDSHEEYLSATYDLDGNLR